MASATGEATVYWTTPDWALVNTAKSTDGMPADKRSKAGVYSDDELLDFQRQFKNNPDLLAGGQWNLTVRRPPRATREVHILQ